VKVISIFADGAEDEFAELNDLGDLDDEEEAKAPMKKP
jgi:hypothetical protein